MFSKEEAKQLREEFWGQFLTLSRQRRIRKKLPGDWILTLALVARRRTEVCVRALSAVGWIRNPARL